MQCHVAGHKLSMPIIVAPMSQQRMAYDEGELAVARAVAKEGTAMVSMHDVLCSGDFQREQHLKHCLLCVLCSLSVVKSSALCVSCDI